MTGRIGRGDLGDELRGRYHEACSEFHEDLLVIQWIVGAANKAT